MTGASGGIFRGARAMTKLTRSFGLAFGLFAGLFILYPVWLLLKGISGPSARRRFTDPFEKSLAVDPAAGTEEPVLSEAIRQTRWTVWLVRALAIALLIGLFPFGLFAPPANAHGTTTLTLDPETATNVVGTSHTVTATLTAGGGHSVANRVVTFTASGTGAETPSSATRTTDANGRATFTFTSTKTGTSDVTAAVSFTEAGGGGSTLHTASDTATKTWHHGPPTTVTVTPTTDTNTVGDPHTITATATDVYGNPISGHTATISVTGAGATETTRTTDVSGTVTFTFSSDEPGTSDIRVTVTSDDSHASGSSGTAAGSATKVWEPEPFSGMTLEPSSDTNTVGETHTVTATVIEADDPVEGQVVTFTVTGTGGEEPTFGTDTTDDEGKATFSFTSTQTGTSTITATNGTDTATATKDWVAGPASTITLTQDSSTNTVGDPHTVTATVVDQYGNAVADGTNVTFTVTGVGATESVRQTIDGVATFTFTSTETGQSTIQAKSGEAESNFLNKTWTAGPPDRLTLEPETATNTVGETHTVTATVFDEGNNPVPGVTVTFTVTGTGGEAPTSGTAVTDEDGEATFEFTSSEPGTSTITATAEGGLEDTVTKVWEETEPGTFVLEPKNATNTVGETHTVTATVRDSEGEPVSGVVVTFTVSGTDGEAPTFGTDVTDDDGKATFSFTSTRTGDSHITATVESGDDTCTVDIVVTCLLPGPPGVVEDTATKTWVAGPASTITLTQDSAINTVGEPHTVTATVTDQYGNAVADGTDVTFTVSGVGATEGVRDTSDGIATFTFTSNQSGQSTIQAQSGGALANSLNKTWQSGPPATLVLEPENDTNIVGDTHTVTATVEDTFNNPVPGVVVTFTVAGTGGEAPTSATDTTDQNGEAHFSFTSTRTGTSRITATGGGQQDTATKTWNAGPASTITLTQGPATNTVGDPHTVTATVVDQYGNAVANGTNVTFTVTGADPTQSVRQTNNGVATFTFTSFESGESTIHARSGGATSNTLTKTWNPGPADSITLTQGSSTNEVGDPHTVIATIRDEHGNVVDSVHTVTFTVTGAGATQGARTTSQGRANFTFTSTQTGMSTITAVASGVSGQSNSLNKTWVAAGTLCPPEAQGPVFPFDIARDIVMYSDCAGFILDGFGAVHAVGNAPTVSAGTLPYFPGFDIAREVVIVFDESGNPTGGYVLDGWGGLHPFAVQGGSTPPSISGLPYWGGFDIARDVVLLSGSSGFLLDGFGAIHPFGTASVISSNPYFGFDIARELVMDDPPGTSGYVLDGWGAMHPFGGKGFLSGLPYFQGHDIANDALLTTPSSGYTLDGFGGIHPFGGAPAVTSAAPYTLGADNYPAFDMPGATGFLMNGRGVIYTFNGSS